MEKTGRYQAVGLGTDVFVIDTQEGHMWLWGTSKEKGVTLMYLGQLSEGKEPLEMLYSFKEAAL